MVEGGPEVGRKATPNHHRTTTVEHHLLDAVLVEALSSAPPHTHTSVWIAQIEFRLIRKQHQTPLLSSPPRMNSRPCPVGSPVGGRVPWTSGSDSGRKPCCTEAIPYSLNANIKIVCNPKNTSDPFRSVIPRRQSLPDDETICSRVG